MKVGCIVCRHVQTSKLVLRGLFHRFDKDRVGYHVKLELPDIVKGLLRRVTNRFYHYVVHAYRASMADTLQFGLLIHVYHDLLPI